MTLAELIRNIPFDHHHCKLVIKIEGIEYELDFEYIQNYQMDGAKIILGTKQ